MKIFNWVHRKFNQKDGSSEKNINGHGSDHNEQYLSMNDAIGDVFDGWKGGILAIGTFGYHPLKDDEKELIMPAEKEEEESDDYMETNKSDETTDSDQDEEDDVNEETNPLVYAVYAHDYGYDHGQEMKMEENNEVTNKEFELEFECDEMIKNARNKRRTTLAELFSADSDIKQANATTFKQEILVKEKQASIINDDNHKHNYGLLSFPKKLIGGEARPVHKLHRLMRRMLKRKIHPELGLNKDINPNIRGSKCGINESASLLPIQDAII